MCVVPMCAVPHACVCPRYAKEVDPRSTFPESEFTVYKTEQAYPEYIVHYHRTPMRWQYRERVRRGSKGRRGQTIHCTVSECVFSLRVEVFGGLRRSPSHGFNHIQG